MVWDVLAHLTTENKNTERAFHTNRTIYLPQSNPLSSLPMSKSSFTDEFENENENIFHIGPVYRLL